MHLETEVVLACGERAAVQGAGPGLRAHQSGLLARRRAAGRGREGRHRGSDGCRRRGARVQAQYQASQKERQRGLFYFRFLRLLGFFLSIFVCFEDFLAFLIVFVIFITF